MGHNKEVSNSNSNTNELSYEELQDVFDELYMEFEKMILKNSDLKKQISLLSKYDLNENISSKNICKNCDNLKEENEFLKDRVERLEMENEFLKGNLSKSKKKNKNLKENVLSLEKEKSTLKENALKVQNGVLKLKTSQNKYFKKNILYVIIFL